MKDDPFEKDDLGGFIDDFFSFSRVISYSRTHIAPPVDIYEINNRFIIVLEIPGIDKQDISITVSDDIIIIKGEKKKKNFIDNEICYYHMEIEYGPFERRLRIPTNSDIDNMEIEYKDGFLKIEIPLKYKKVKKINIE